MTERQRSYVQTLKNLIGCQTVSVVGEEDKSKFFAFHDLLGICFPNLFEVLEKEVFNGSLLLRWRGKNSSSPVMFMNHHDVVEATGEWKFPPFSAEIFDGKVWGRGVLDTKGGLFCMLQAGEELVKEGFIPQSDVYFVSTCDEETEGLGARLISKELENRGLKFQFVLDEGGMIVEEPISGAKGDYALIGVGEKSISSIKFTARSAGGHASTPPKNSPLVRLGKFMAEVDSKKLFKVELSNVFCKMFKTISTGMKPPLKWVLGNAKFFSPVLKKVVPNLSLSAGAMMKTTVAFTMAQASGGDNVIPESASVVANVRCCQHQGIDESFSILQKIANKYGVLAEIIDKGTESPISDYSAKEFAMIEQTIAEIYEGAKTCPYVMTGASDCRFMSGLSKNCYRFTPFKINSEQLDSIHGVNENVDVKCLDKAVDFYKSVVKKIN